MIREINERRPRRLLQWFARADEWSDDSKQATKLDLTGATSSSGVTSSGAVTKRYVGPGEVRDQSSATVKSQMALVPDVEIGAHQ